MLTLHEILRTLGINEHQLLHLITRMTERTNQDPTPSTHNQRARPHRGSPVTNKRGEGLRSRKRPLSPSPRAQRRPTHTDQAPNHHW